MFKGLILTASLTALAAVPAAAPCRDKGKFVKCPVKVPAKPLKCKDAKGKFVKCGTSGAKPV